AALPDPTYTAEFVDGARAVIATELAPRLLAADGPASATDLDTILADVAGHHMARATLELALLDAECRRRQQPLVDRLTPTPPGPRAAVPAGVALGLHESPEALAEEVRSRVAEGYRRLKLKIAPGRDVEFVDAARRSAGPDVVLLADANGAYRWDTAPGAPDDARILVAMDEFGLAAIEQPLPADDLLDSAELARRMHTPIALDESLTSRTAVRQALDLGAASVVCVKAPMLGSWLDAAAVLDTCAGLGIDAYVGGMLDGGIGRAATIALAAHPGATIAGDVSATARFFTDDVCGPVEVHEGAVAVPTTFGVEVDHDAVERCTIRLDTIRR
ncbi:MAG: o-succinylbenzoate synthase, partial [Acidimicrobiia bacterium]|nr:o-succinylbenzoate synthase [Acidimicrobiia bacterium]